MFLLIINMLFIVAFAAYEKIRGSSEYRTIIIILFCYGIGCIAVALIGGVLTGFCGSVTKTTGSIIGKASASVTTAAQTAGLSDIGGIATMLLPEAERKSKAALTLSFILISSSVTALFSAFGISAAKYCADRYFGEEIGNAAKVVIIYDTAATNLSLLISIASALAAA